MSDKKRQRRTKSVATVLSKVFKPMQFEGMWQEVFGLPEMKGLWLIYGAEKNGKTWIGLKIAEYMTSFAKTLYVSAEQGTDMDFQNSLKRAKMDYKNKLIQFIEYESFEELDERLSKHKAPRIVVICLLYTSDAADD